MNPATKKNSKTKYDPKQWLEQLRQGEILNEYELRMLCLKVKEILMEESNVQPVNAPVSVVGNINGQFYDLLNLFKIGGQVPETRYIFMGGMINRGQFSVEVFQLLMCLKLNQN